MKKVVFASDLQSDKFYLKKAIPLLVYEYKDHVDVYVNDFEVNEFGTGPTLEAAITDVLKIIEGDYDNLLSKGDDLSPSLVMYKLALEQYIRLKTV